MFNQLSVQRLVAGIIQVFNQRINLYGISKMCPGPVLGLQDFAAAGIDLFFGYASLSDRFLYCRNGFVHIGWHQQDIVPGFDCLHLPDARFKIAAQALHIKGIGNDQALESHFLFQQSCNSWAGKRRSAIFPIIQLRYPQVGHHHPGESPVDGFTKGV